MLFLATTETVVASGRRSAPDQATRSAVQAFPRGSVGTRKPYKPWGCFDSHAAYLLFNASRAADDSSIRSAPPS